MADLRTALEEARQQANSKSICHSGSMMSSLIEARPRGSGGESFWVQLHSGMLNMQFLHDEDPVAVIFKGVGELPASVELVGWEPKLFCTFDIGSLTDEQTLAMVKVMLHSYFGLGQDCEFTVMLEDLS
jgi:hypothetical protein